MGLQEKRAQAEVDGKIGEFASAIAKAAGGSCGGIKIDWASYEGATVDAIQKTVASGITPLVEAIRNVCKDDVGRKTYNNAVLRYEIKYTKDGNESKITIANKTLTYNGQWEGACWMSGDLQKQIEEQL